MIDFFGVFPAVSLLILAICPCFIFKDDRDSESQLKICQLLSVRRVIRTLLCNGVCNLQFLAMEPTLVIKLRTDFGFSTSKIWLFFFLFFLGSAFTMGLSLFVP